MATVGTNALVTFDEARDYMKRENTDDDDRIAEYVDVATAAVEVYTKRKLKSRTYDGGIGNEPKMLLSGRGSNEIALREYPVTSVTAALVRYSDGSTRALNVGAYRLLHGGRRLALPYDSFAEGDSNIEVSCVAGYLAGTHVSELRTLKLATLRYLQVLWQDRDLAVGRGSNISVGGESLSFIGDAIPKDIALLLRSFERWI